MGQFITDMQYKIKTSSTSLITFILKTITGAFLGLTLALIGQEMLGYGTFSFVLFIVVTAGAFLRLAKSWSWIGVLVFNLICVLIGLLLRMYIVIAPG